MQVFKDFDRTYIISQHNNGFRVRQYNQNAVLVGEMMTGKEWLDMMGFEFFQSEKQIAVLNEEGRKQYKEYADSFKCGDIVNVVSETKCYFIIEEVFVHHSKHDGRIWENVYSRYISKKHGVKKGIIEKYRDDALTFTTRL